MIKKIRQALIIRYTVIMAGILILGCVAGYAAYRHNGIKLLQNGLRDYLTAEVWEAGREIDAGELSVEIHKIKSSVRSLNNFTYWIVDGKVVRAERPEDDYVSDRLERRLLTKEYEAGKIYHENVLHGKNKWYFIVIKQNVQSDKMKNAQVFVLANYTPVRRNADTYIRIALTATAAMILLAFFISNFFVARSMKYIERSYEKQKQFVSDAAHELRTPLAVLLSYAELLEYKPQRTDIIADIQDEVRRMNDLVDRLLAVARYDNSKAVMRKEIVNVNETVRQAVDAMKNLCPPDTFRLTVCAQDADIRADGVMLRQLMNILLDNAVKYTPERKEIAVRIERDGARMKICVADNGIGIKKEDLTHIFDRFWRAEESRHQKGVGLGLSLAQGIIQMHKGKITVQSVVGQGSTFEVSLPVK